MSKLNVDQKNIEALLSDKKSDFLIPDYQRPYAWDENNCQTLWDDIFAFAFPNNNSEDFDESEEYFLGSIVTFKNEKGKLEVIDGQQRLTTLMLILRAFYDKFANMQDNNSKLTRTRIEKCIWRTDTFGTADKSFLKIDSEVATDNDKGEFLELLKTGVVVLPGSKSNYVKNYQFFQAKINEFLSTFPGYFAYLPARMLGNCILLPIEAESQDTALRIFSTLNDRGLPLSDADIFKAQFYKYYGDKGEKDDFIEEWKNLEEITGRIFHPFTGTPMDELFTRYMYYLRAKEGNKKTTVEALRKFFERNKYQYLKTDQTIKDLKSLALFWESTVLENDDTFSEDIRKKLFVLNYAPNGMWQYITSVYYLDRNADGKLEESSFAAFLDKITAFIFAYAITNPGVNALRSPLFEELINLIKGEPVSFENRKFNEQQARSFFENFEFTNGRPITRSLITWYAYTFKNQALLDTNKSFQIEHIFARKRQDMERSLTKQSNLESLGNKVLLEESINISASDYRFEDKKKIYSGAQRRGKNQEPSQIAEIQDIIELNEFDETAILNRNQVILNKFFEFLRNENLLVSE